MTRLTEFWHIVGVIYAICSSRKYPYLPHGRECNFLGGGGFYKTKKFKEMYEAQLEFPEGWGNLEKFPSVGEVWIFSGTKVSLKCNKQKCTCISFQRSTHIHIFQYAHLTRHILFFRTPACCIVLLYDNSFRQPGKVTWFHCVFKFHFRFVSHSFDYG